MTRIRFGILPLVLICTGAGTAAAEQIYKWIDEQGRVQFSQTPPHSVATPQAVQTVEIQDAPVNPQAGEEAVASEETPATDPTTRWEQARQKNCEIARKNLERLQGDVPLGIREGDAVREMTQAERREQLKRAKREAEAYCK